MRMMGQYDFVSPPWRQSFFRVDRRSSGILRGAGTLVAQRWPAPLLDPVRITLERARQGRDRDRGRASPGGHAMDLQLGGKLALVTGSTAGIGFAIAKALAAEGARVVVNGRTEARVAEASAAIAEACPEAQLEGLAADLGTAAGAELALERFPDLAILVNNVGIFEPRPFEEIRDDEWQKMIEVNFMSGVRLSRHHLPRMKARNWGRIIFIASESAVNIPVEMIHYGVTKTMQVALARGLAETTVGTGVTVNSILPGPTRSEGVGQFVKDLARSQGKTEEEMERAFFETARPSSLLRRFETTDEIAALVAFVASPMSSATNGAALRADGGLLRSIL
jgi:NAD(P)-dependent dehydrogenase (short-subunit alcohol dehydrogenase family)